MTGRIIANRLLEADEDFNISGEIERLTSSPYPNIELESEGNHWNVYKKNAAPGPGNPPLSFIGEIYYDDMTDAPPEAHPHWDKLRWMAIAGFRKSEMKPCQSFDQALQFILAVNAAKTARPVGEAVNPDDPAMNIEKFSKERSVPVEMEVFNDLGRRFRVQIVWDKPAGGTAYDAEGNEVPEKLQPTVEFYDMTHARNPDYANTSIAKNGQFVSSYYAATLMERPHGGLDLMGHEPVWKIDASAMDKVRAWIKSEVEGRGYKLVNDEADGISFGMRYEGLDPDDPELYIHPEKFTQQPSYEKIEGALRRMLAPYYSQVRISRRPGIFADREMIQRNVPGEPEGTEHRIIFQDGWNWTIHCKRDTPLPLPKTAVNYHGQPLDTAVMWRQQVKQWFWDWARESGLYLFNFEIYGRLRKDPTFQFQTARLGPLKEGLDDPEQFLAHHVKTVDWDHDLREALWKFHPYGVGYEVIGFPRGAYIVATTCFEPDKDDFARRFRDYAVNWLKENRIMPLKFAKLYTFPHANRPKDYPQWSVIAAINVPWADKDLPEHAPTVDIGEPGVPTGGQDAPNPA